MNDDRLINAVWITLAILLPLSALLARRVPARRMLWMVLGWIGLFAAGFVIFEAVGPQLTSWQQSRRQGTVRLDGAFGKSLEIPVGQDGHFWVEADVGGTRLRFLIDSGASVTGLSDAAAERVGLEADPLGSTFSMQTANGQITARRMTINRMRIGPILVEDLPVAVSPGLGDVNILGMNFLAKLKSWRVEDGRMILTPL